MIKVRYENISAECYKEIIIRLKTAYPCISKQVEMKLGGLGNGNYIIEFIILRTDSGESEKEIVKIISDVVIEEM